MPIFAAAYVMLQKSSDPSEGLVYGPNCWFMVSAPKGWVLEGKTAKDDGPSAIFYPKGSTWEDSKTVFYVTMWPKEGLSFGEVMKADQERTHDHQAGIVATKIKSIKTSDGRKAIVELFETPKGDVHDEVAYIDTPKTVVMIAMSSRSLNGLASNKAAYWDLVKSFSFISDSVQIEEPKKGKN